MYPYCLLHLPLRARLADRHRPQASLDFTFDPVEDLHYPLCDGHAGRSYARLLFDPFENIASLGNIGPGKTENGAILRVGGSEDYATYFRDDRFLNFQFLTLLDLHPYLVGYALCLSKLHHCHIAHCDLLRLPVLELDSKRSERTSEHSRVRN